MHAELTLAISQVNCEVNFNLCMEKPAINSYFSPLFFKIFNIHHFHSVVYVFQDTQLC